MAKKKSFAIGHSLTQALTDTVVAAKNYSGELHIEILPLRKIDLDPGNPRELALTFSDVYGELTQSDEHFSRKLKEKESLQSIANSITAQGVINPIVVYKHGERYRLIAGERRTLASILAKKEDIPARILSAKPNQLKLSLLQWIENIEREDLSLWERIKNLEKILKAYSTSPETNGKKITATEIGQLLGCSSSQAANYKNVLDASHKLRSLIQSNQIKSIEKAALIAKAPAKLEELLLEHCLKGATLKELNTIIAKNKTSSGTSTSKQLRGRQMTRVNFGATRNIGVAKAIIESVLSNENFSHLRKEFSEIAWEDYKSVAETFKTLVKKLEITQSKGTQ